MSNTERPAWRVLYEDNALLAVDKPAGMPVQPDPTGDPSLLDLVRQQAGPAGTAIGLPHRIDRPVSGVVVFTRDATALSALNTAFREGRVEKTYLAIVQGAPPEQGECDHVLQHHTGRHKASASESGDGRAVRLRFVKRAQGDRFALLEVVPQGGAFHQIRAQLAAIGHPIKGDVKYGARRGEPDRSIALHAACLRFAHPYTGAWLTIAAPDPVRSIWPAMLALRS